MSEPIITPAAVYTFGGVVGAGHLLGMPVDAVVLGAVASAAVEQVEAGKTKSFTQVLSYARIAPYSDLFEQGTLWKR